MKQKKTKKYGEIESCFNEIARLCREVSRDINYQSVKRPSLKNIRKLFDIAEVDKIIFLYRDSLYNSNSENPDSIELNISKNNNGKLGSFDYRI